MRIGIIAEDLSDIEAVGYMLKKINADICIEKKPCRGAVLNKLDHRIEELINRFDDIRVILVLSDLDNKNCAEHLKKIGKAAKDKISDLVIIQIVIQEIEAWYLALPDSIETAFPNLKPVPRFSGKTDTINDPKKKLKEIFLKKYQRDYRITSDGPKIAKNFVYLQNQNYPNESLNRFVRKISELN